MKRRLSHRYPELIWTARTKKSVALIIVVVSSSLRRFLRTSGHYVFEHSVVHASMHALEQRKLSTAFWPCIEICSKLQVHDLRVTCYNEGWITWHCLICWMTNWLIRQLKKQPFANGRSFIASFLVVLKLKTVISSEQHCTHIPRRCVGEGLDVPEREIVVERVG